MTAGAAPRAYVAREVQLDDGPLRVFEAADPGAALDDAIARGAPAPYGAVLWDAGVAVARMLRDVVVPGHRVIDIGTGCGICALAAARIGARVLATDVDEGALHAVTAAARAQGLDVETATFDIEANAPLPHADVVVIADLLYEPVLARAVARRVREALAARCLVVVGDPGRAGRATFIDALSAHGITASFVDAVCILRG